MTDTGRAVAADRVRAIIADFFSVPVAAVSDDTVVDDIPGWDSTTHVGLILEVEDRLGIEFDVARITAFRDVGDLIDECARACGE
ncbi:acyl carrier protein [Sphingomonas sp. TZW2008]|uniref:acyl carrier protein n=1 Tax=Sphingomonas sp. TZW2008 TaxID=1917973 RepID=UPI000A26F5F9|nr:acyl carrier protein [Sphingomonas sp. TZW2008]